MREEISMKTRILFSTLCAAFLFSASTINAEVAAGVILGEPTGISVRINHFPILGFAWSGTYNWTYIYGDYILIDRTVENNVRWYLGAGAAILIGNNESGIGGRVPVGLLYTFDPKFELFGEIVPGIELAPDMRMIIGAGIGIRYIFKG
jgi:hypothetical protein